MIYSLTGEISHIENGLMVIDCGGVGYGVRTTTTTLSKLPPIGAVAKVFTYMNVREDACELFGFTDTSELNCFKLLISVSGVGPKAALSILSNVTPEKFAICVASSDSKTLTLAQGIGSKIAQRIVLELKDKITNEQLTAGITNAASTISATTTTNATEAISALVVLGYSQSDATMALTSIEPDASVEDMIKHGLKKLATLK